MTKRIVAAVAATVLGLGITGAASSPAHAVNGLAQPKHAANGLSNSLANGLSNSLANGLSNSLVTGR